MLRILLIVALTFCLGQGCPPPVSEPPPVKVPICETNYWNESEKLGFNPIIPGTLPVPGDDETVGYTLDLVWTTGSVKTFLRSISNVVVYTGNQARTFYKPVYDSLGFVFLTDVLILLPNGETAWYMEGYPPGIEINEVSVFAGRSGDLIYLKTLYPSSVSPDTVLRVGAAAYSLCFE